MDVPESNHWARVISRVVAELGVLVFFAWDGWLRLRECFIAEQEQGVPVNTVAVLL